MAERSAAAASAALRAHRVVVVGAGVAGLVAALQLACKGLAVTLVERAATPGGKMRRIAVDGVEIDSGPTVFTMRWVFEQIFDGAGASLTDRLRLTPLDVLARHAWGQGGTLDLHADPQRSVAAIEAFAGADEAQRFEQFCAQARALYGALELPYIRSARPTVLQMAQALGTGGLAELTRLGPGATLWTLLARRFREPRLRQLFGRYATYCGSSPLAAPATLMLIAQVELDGVWTAEGGMHGVACALAQLARERGAELRYGVAVSSIEVQGGRARAVVLDTGERLEADSIVFNGDVNALASGRLGAAACSAVDAVPIAARSLSAVTWSMHARTRGFALHNHNVFFDDDYASEFNDIFDAGRLPRKATVYMCAQDRVGPDAGHCVAADARERLLCLVNAPALGDRHTASARPGAPSPLSNAEIDACEHRMQQLLTRCGLSVEIDPEASVRTTPNEFEHLFPATGGALYGRATHGWMALFKRPSAVSRIPGLYLAGGSVHPGPGVPMAAMSGQLAAATLLAHLDSTSRSRQVVISGGMSTRSVTTAGTA
jgi:1-hydroxycarotenoid 3,4-desaturase